MKIITQSQLDIVLSKTFWFPTFKIPKTVEGTL